MDTKRLFWGSVAISLILFALLLLWIFAIQIPHTRQRQALYLQTCLSNAIQEEKNDWANACQNFGIDTTDSNCTLSQYHADQVWEFYLEEKNSCFKQFPQ